MQWAGRKQGAFTLMEAVVALAVFTVGMLGLGGTFSQIVRVNATSAQKQVATLLAERKLAQFRMTGTGELTQTGGTFAVPFDGYTWQAQIRSSSQDLETTEVWMEVAFGSGVMVRLWSEVAARHGQR